MTDDPAGIEDAAVAVPDVFLNDSHLSAARNVLERVIGIANSQLAFVSGSLAAGLGHGLSDVDLYVAQFDGVPAERSYRENGFIVQVNPVSDIQIELIRRTCANFCDTAAKRKQTSMTDAELQRPLRYAIGTVLVDRGTGLPSARDSIRTVRRILMNRGAYWLSSFAEDALGALQIGDRFTALEASLMGVECALDCALAGAGDVYLGRKFQLRRSARVRALRDVRSDLWAYLRQPDVLGDGAEINKLVVGRMLFSTHLVSCALLDGWDEPLDRIPAFADRRGEGGPVRSPWVTPVRFSDSWGMAGPDVGYRATASMVRLWKCLDGRPTEAIHREFAGNPADTLISREHLDTAIMQLVEKKAAVSDSGLLLDERRDTNEARRA